EGRGAVLRAAQTLLNVAGNPVRSEARQPEGGGDVVFRLRVERLEVAGRRSTARGGLQRDERGEGEHNEHGETRIVHGPPFRMMIPAAGWPIVPARNDINSATVLSRAQR